MLLRVHLNLQKGLFSLVNPSTGLVTGYADSLALKDATMRIQPAGQRKARHEGQRNVHAYIKGSFFVPESFPDEEELIEVYYNPFKNDTFIVGGLPILKADTVYFKNKKCYVRGK